MPTRRLARKLATTRTLARRRVSRCVCRRL